MRETKKCCWVYLDDISHQQNKVTVRSNSLGSWGTMKVQINKLDSYQTTYTLEATNSLQQIEHAITKKKSTPDFRC